MIRVSPINKEDHQASTKTSTITIKAKVNRFKNVLFISHGSKTTQDRIEEEDVAEPEGAILAHLTTNTTDFPSSV